MSQAVDLAGIEGGWIRAASSDRHGYQKFMDTDHIESVDEAEQRGSPRTSAIYPLRFWVAGLGARGAGRTRNLSDNGLQFVTGQALRPGTEVRLRIGTGRWGRPPLEFPASVVRCQPRGGASYAIACCLD